MEVWQHEYLNNIARIAALSKMPAAETPEKLEAEINKRQEQVRVLALENASQIRCNLFPVLDSIINADSAQLARLQEFAGKLSGPGRPDNNLALHIHEFLLLAARCRHDRDLLIRELYECGLGSFYFLDNCLASYAPEKFRKKIRLYFREGASYLRIYDDISSTQTRGYIHRCMANIALSYSRTECLPKLEVINASIRVLTDPVYHEKTPDLPWDRFIYASHQERTTLLFYLRNVEATPEVASQVMESAQIIRNTQEERARKLGRPLEARWEYVYAGALFFSGITDLRAYLDTLLGIWRDASADDFSPSGYFANATIVAFIMDALDTYGASLQEEYSDLVIQMLRGAVDYMWRAIRDTECANLFSQVEKLLQAFFEVPGGMTLRDFFHSLVPLANRDLYIHSVVCEKLNRFLMDLCLREKPELLGSLSGEQEDLLDFAGDAGLLHDIGLLLYPQVYITPIRLRLQSEEEFRQWHTFHGSELLSKHPSSRRCAWVALGHHYPAGYPEEYRREEDPTPLLTDMTILSNFLSKSICGFNPDLSKQDTLEQCLSQIQNNPEGRFHPDLACLVCAHGEELAQTIQTITRELYTSLWQSFCLPQNPV